MKPSLLKLSAKEKQNCFRADAARFFEWCRFNLNHYVEKLDATDKEAFESGKVTKNILDVVQAAWSDDLKTYLPWSEHFAAIRKALPNPSDYDLWMNCPMGRIKNLPKRIQTAVANGEKRRATEIHRNFFANEGEQRLPEYLGVWQSQIQAMNKLMIEASGYKCKKGGGASIGSTEIDFEQMMLSEAEATGSAMKVTGLPGFLRSLWETDKTVIVKTTEGIEHRVIPNPDRSETRLNSFLIKLGQKLADTKRRRELPDWMHMDQTLRFIVHGWCENIIVDGEHWPQLCFLTTPALAKFLTFCNPQRWKANQDPRTLEKSILRLGLMRIPRHCRFNHFEKKFGEFHFS